MRLVLSRSTVGRKPELMITFLQSVADDIQFLRASYPRFDEWLLGKVIPGIYSGERTALIEQRDSVVAGLLIVKHTDLERKLCTLRIRPPFESQGLGVRLFETAFDLLETDRPLLSVSETSKPKFSRLFDHFGFAQEAVYEGRYLPRVDEFSYNGLLDPSKNWPVPNASLDSELQEGSFEDAFLPSICELPAPLRSASHDRFVRTGGRLVAARRLASPQC